jgi:hypothetical protein
VPAVIDAEIEQVPAARIVTVPDDVTEQAEPVFVYEIVPSPAPSEGVAGTENVESPYVFETVVVANEMVRPLLLTVSAPGKYVNE